MAVVTVRSAVPARPCLFPAVLVRVLVTMGLALVGWVLAAVLGAAAHAEPLPEPAPADRAAASERDTPASTERDCGATEMAEAARHEAEPTEPSEPTEPAEPAEPAEPTENDPAEPAEPDEQATPCTKNTQDTGNAEDTDDTTTNPAERERSATDTEGVDQEQRSTIESGSPEPTEPTTRHDSADRAEYGLLLGTVRGVVGTVERTVDGLGRTVEGAISPILELPSILPEPDLGSVLPGILPIAQEPDPSTGAAQDPPLAEVPALPAPPPPAPEDAPKPEESSRPQLVEPVRAPVVSIPHTAEPPAETNADGRSGGGGGAPPVAPVSVGTAPSHVTSSHDGNGSQRADHGTLNWAPTLTQLRLFGVSRDSDAGGAGRDAALPTTSPD